MMDELELLKKDWQTNSEQTNQKISSKDIYPMMHKKSSSIVKTLFYISLAELAFWIILNSYPFFSSEAYRAEINAMYGGNAGFIALTVFSYAVILIFVYLLYKSYKTISITDSAKKLMEKILKTRKIIKYYVIYNLVVAFLSISFGMYYTVYNNPELAPQFEKFNDKQMFVSTLLMVVFAAIFILIIWVFYRLIYGILLRRLNKNYKELKKLEV